MIASDWWNRNWNCQGGWDVYIVAFPPLHPGMGLKWVLSKSFHGICHKQHLFFSTAKINLTHWPKVGSTLRKFPVHWRASAYLACWSWSSFSGRGGKNGKPHLRWVPDVDFPTRSVSDSIILAQVESRMQTPALHFVTRGKSVSSRAAGH